jgi:hypothetical protein
MSTVTAQRSATLTPQHRRAIELLVTGRDVTDVARALDVHRVTVWRWTQLPAFRRELTAAEDDARRAMTRTLESAARASVLYLASVLADDKAPTGSKVQSAAVLLSKWALLQPQQVDARVDYSGTMRVDTGDGIDDLRQMLDDIRSKREGTAFLAPGKAIDAASVPTNGHSNGHANGHANGHEDGGEGT